MRPAAREWTDEVWRKYRGRPPFDRGIRIGTRTRRRAGAIRHVLIGVIGGTFSGLAGLGGGTIMVPLMVRHLGMVQVRAHGTSLGVIIFTAMASAAGYSLDYIPDWRIVLVMVAPALLMAPLGARTASRLDNNRLRKVFAGFLAVAAVLLLVLADPESIFAQARVRVRARYRRRNHYDQRQALRVPLTHRQEEHRGRHHEYSTADPQQSAQIAGGKSDQTGRHQQRRSLKSKNGLRIGQDQ